MSDEARERLYHLLPSTAFQGYQPSIEHAHPSQSGHSDDDAMDIDFSNGFRCADAVDLSVFNDPHFLAAAHTFQDHIYTGWMTDSNLEKVLKFESGVKDGSVHAPWKDEVWERDNSTVTEGERAIPMGSQTDWSARAGYVLRLELV